MTDEQSALEGATGQRDPFAVLRLSYLAPAATVSVGEYMAMMVTPILVVHLTDSDVDTGLIVVC